MIFRRKPTTSPAGLRSKIREERAAPLPGLELPLILRRHPRARRLKLRYDPHREAAVLTLPPHHCADRARAFAREHSAWLRAEAARHPARDRIRPGGTLPYEGQEHLLLHRAGRASGVSRAEGKIYVDGPLHGFEKRLELWLRRAAGRRLADRAEAMAARLGVRYSRVRLGDAKTRWGSCSARGVLAFNWRLVMAPPAVLDYVAAHEVAHLREMNHSPAFWALVDRLVPHRPASRAWLKAQGPALMALKFTPLPPAPEAPGFRRP